MVTGRIVLLLTVTALLLTACGVDDDSGGTTATARTPAPTRAVISGPSASVAPRSGPPGTEITVSGNGWPARSVIEVVARTGQGAAYASVAAADDGSFTARFRLEKQPDGSDLRVGPFDLIARSGATEVPFAFQVETRRPLNGAGPGG